MLKEPFLKKMELMEQPSNLKLFWRKIKTGFDSHSNNCCSSTSICTKATDYLLILILIISSSLIQNISSFLQCIPGIPGTEPCSQSSPHSARLDYPIIDQINKSVKIIEIIFILFWCLFFIFNVIIIIFYQYKYHHNTISITIFPLLIKFEILLRTYLFSHFMNKLITTIIIKWIGRPTPNYYQTYNIQSFPSSYTSVVWCWCWLLSLYSLNSMLSIRHLFFVKRRAALNLDIGVMGELLQIQQKEDGYINSIQLIDPHFGNSYFGTYCWLSMRYCMIIQLLLVLSPLFFAFYGSCNQLIDYKYFYIDVVCGALIGFGCSTISYIVHYKEFYTKKTECFWSNYTSLIGISCTQIDAHYNI